MFIGFFFAETPLGRPRKVLPSSTFAFFLPETRSEQSSEISSTETITQAFQLLIPVTNPVKQIAGAGRSPQPAIDALRTGPAIGCVATVGVTTSQLYRSTLSRRLFHDIYKPICFKWNYMVGTFYKVPYSTCYLFRYELSIRFLRITQKCICDI